MEKQLQSKSIKSFTFIESLLIILILTILLNATLRVNVFNNISLSDDIKATQFVNQLEYFKSKAMRNHQSNYIVNFKTFLNYKSNRSTWWSVQLQY